MDPSSGGDGTKEEVDGDRVIWKGRLVGCRARRGFHDATTARLLDV